MKKLSLKVIAFAATLLVGNIAFAAYPEKPITLIVPFAPNGGTDIATRNIVDALSKELGQKVNIKNVGGEGGRLGTEELIVAEPDGYTLLMSSISTAITNTLGENTFKYDTVDDFTHVGNLVDTPHVLSLRKDFPANNFKEFQEEMKKNKIYSYASIGVGSSQHFLMDYYKHLVGAKITHHPYRGGGPAIIDTAKGIVDMNLDQIQSSMAAIKKGEVKPIAISGTSRLKALPDVPTFKEVGMDAINYGTFYGISGPEGMSPEVVKTINDAMKRAANQPGVKERYEDLGMTINVSSPEEFIDKLKKEKVIYERFAKEANIKLN